jgi:3-hydroxyisobutyrate dehydrogenase-like beta-hydroxyacid dehydrogenase
LALQALEKWATQLAPAFWGWGIPSVFGTATPDKTTGSGQCRRAFGGHTQVLAESVDVVSHCSPTKPPSTTFILVPMVCSLVRRQKIFIDMSTVKPAKPKEMALRANAVGAVYLECPCRR